MINQKVFIVILLFLLLFLNKFEIVKKGERCFIDLFSFPLRVITPLSSKKSINIIGQGKLKKESRELKQKIKELKQKIVQLNEAAQENERLRGLLSFKSREYFSIPARVIGKSSDNWRKIIIIDKGKRDGVAEDMAVITKQGLVGRVIDSGLSSSRVMLIIDFNSKVATLVQRNREQGIVEGKGNICQMKYIDKSSDICNGDIIISSGMGGIYPKGLIIGEVNKIKMDAQKLSINAQILPAVNLHRLEEVLCLKEVSP